MTIPTDLRGLRFPVNVFRRGWRLQRSLGRNHKEQTVAEGTKRRFLNVVSQEPKTITQIAEALSLSTPSVHTHVRDMLRSELFARAVEWEKTHPAERYYEPNFQSSRIKSARNLVRFVRRDE